MQELIILLSFIVSIIYLLRLIIENFSFKQGCAKGCGSCDLTKIANPHSSKMRLNDNKDRQASYKEYETYYK